MVKKVKDVNGQIYVKKQKIKMNKFEIQITKRQANNFFYFYAINPIFSKFLIKLKFLNFITN